MVNKFINARAVKYLAASSTIFSSMITNDEKQLFIIGQVLRSKDCKTIILKFNRTTKRLSIF